MKPVASDGKRVALTGLRWQARAERTIQRQRRESEMGRQEATRWAPVPAEFSGQMFVMFGSPSWWVISCEGIDESSLFLTYLKADY